MSKSLGKVINGTPSYNATAVGGTQKYLNYLNGLDTSTVDNTLKNLTNNAYALSSQLPDYVYNADGSDEARQRMENSYYNNAVSKMNRQYGLQQQDLQTKLANQGIAVGSEAYNNAMNNFYDNYNNALNDAAFNSINYGQQAFSSSLKDAIDSGNFTNKARQASLEEILSALQNSVSKGQVQRELYTIANQGQSKMKSAGMGLDGLVNFGNKFVDFGNRLASLSDARLKENIKPVGKLDNGLTVYCFNFLGSATRQLGLLAQEVAELHPEAVFEDADGYLSVDYDEACL